LIDMIKDIKIEFNKLEHNSRTERSISYWLTSRIALNPYPSYLVINELTRHIPGGGGEGLMVHVVW